MAPLILEGDMIPYTEGLLRYLNDVENIESLYVKLARDELYRRETYLKSLFNGRLSLFLDKQDLSVGTCEVVTTCGVRKSQPVELLETFHSFKKGYEHLLEQFRPINKKLLIKYWDLKPDLLTLVTVGKVMLPDIDNYT